MRRESARAGNALGEYPDGERTIPASIAASCGCRSDAGFKVAARGRLDPVIAVAEVDGVQVSVQNLCLGIALFEPDGNRHFTDLARERAGGTQLLEAGQLLRQRAASFHDASGPPVTQCGFQNARGVEAVMLIEAPIFDREERADHVRRYAIERNVGALLGEERKDRPVLPVEHDRALRVRGELRN